MQCRCVIVDRGTILLALLSDKFKQRLKFLFRRRAAGVGVLLRDKKALDPVPPTDHFGRCREVCIARDLDHQHLHRRVFERKHLQCRGCVFFCLVRFDRDPLGKCTPLIGVIAVIAVLKLFGIGRLRDLRLADLAHYPIVFAQLFVSLGDRFFHQLVAGTSKDAADLKRPVQKAGVSAVAGENCIDGRRADLFIDGLGYLGDLSLVVSEDRGKSLEFCPCVGDQFVIDRYPRKSVILIVAVDLFCPKLELQRGFRLEVGRDLALGRPIIFECACDVGRIGFVFVRPGEHQIGLEQIVILAEQSLFGIGQLRRVYDRIRRGKLLQVGLDLGDRRGFVPVLDHVHIDL